MPVARAQSFDPARPTSPLRPSQVVNFRATTASGYAPKKKFRVGVLGATGAVGQRFLQYLDGHPWFEVTALGASSRSAGKKYEDATQWQLSANLPAYVRGQNVSLCDAKELSGKVDLVFSALVRREGGRGSKFPPLPRQSHSPPFPSTPPSQDADVAGDVEKAFSDAGVPVFSNARNYRMVSDVPLVVPPVNGDHLELVRMQPAFHKNGGFIVTNANCSTTGMVIALKPLADAFGIEHVNCTTLQAISGAGYPGLPSLDILDNVVPFISGEEDKLETEYKKIMGAYTPGSPSVTNTDFPLSAMVNRVHVRDGHSIALSIKLKTPATPQEVAAVLRNYKPAVAELSSLPSAPAFFIEVREESNRPQPRLDRDTGKGYTTVVGRIRPDPLNTVKIFVLSHNTVMGAAGSSILNAELAAAKGLLKHRSG
jgi:aspartate-semialdehyde dehydrogenase